MDEDVIIPDLPEAILAYRGLGYGTKKVDSKTLFKPPSWLTDPPPRYVVQGFGSRRITPEEEQEFLLKQAKELAEWKALTEGEQEPNDSGPLVHSRGGKVKWTTEPLKAQCARFVFPIEGDPNPSWYACEAPCSIAKAKSHNGHGCGIYAVKDPAEISSWGSFPLIAEIWLWGKVYEYAKGYRAEYAQIKKLWTKAPSQLPHLQAAGFEVERYISIEDITRDPFEAFEAEFSVDDV